MTTKNIVLKSAICALALWGTSCKDFLQEDSDSVVTGKEFYSSLGDAYAVKAGLYSTMQKTTEYAYVWGEVRGDLLAEGPGLNSNNDLKSIFKFEGFENSKYLNVAEYYNLIQQCNEALEHFGKMGEVVPEMIADGGDLVHQLQSEAIILRAKCYFDMIRTFGDVPFSLKPINDVNDNTDVEVFGKDEILNHLEKDLLWAVNYVFDSMTDVRVDDLTNGTTLDFVEDGEVLRTIYRWNDALGREWNRTTVNMAYGRALLGDIYMFRQKYTAAVEQYELIELNGGNNEVQLQRKAVDYEWFNFLEPSGSSNPRSAGTSTSGTSAGNNGIGGGSDWLRRIFTDNGVSAKADCELVFYLRYDDKYRQTNFYHQYFLPEANGGDYYFTPADASLSVWDGDTYRGEGHSFKLDTMGTTIYPVVWKFLANAAGKDYRINDDGNFLSDISYFVKRVADCQLKAAEAYNRLGQRGKAVNILNNIVRKRVSEEKAPITETSTMEEIEDVIFNERQLELAYEGERWFDLVRFAKRRGPAFLANRVANRMSDPAEQDRVRNYLMTEDNWYLPMEHGGTNIIQIN
ncbi:RagB/SusD family nutrient uptake outer membrane protein [Puteibacter caeruleilacunae]|nr:RagB/SusD family nutrient uptake outer membrane protein [Puteibacter caeruleilacunae]